MWRICAILLILQLTIRSGNCGGANMVGVDCKGGLVTRTHTIGEWREADGSCCVDNVAVMSDGRVLGIKADHQLYIKNAPRVGEWELIPNSCCIQDVAVMANGYILGVTRDDRLVKRALLNNDWVDVPKSLGVFAVDVFPNGNILGLKQSGELRIRNNLSGNWRFYKSEGVNVKDIAIQPDGTVIGIGKSLDALYILKDDVWELVPESGCVNSIVSTGNLI